MNMTVIQQLVFIIPSAIIIGYLANRLYFRGEKCKSKRKLNGKVIIVTGANAGIGYDTALDMAIRGGTVILACRDLTRGNYAKVRIVAESKSEDVHLEQLDLASLKSIEEFSNRFRARFNRLDILINNAGLSGIPFQKTKDGFEMQFGSMHLGHFYLTHLLIDLIKKSAPSRIVNVSSSAHTRGKIAFDSFQSDKSYHHFTAYAQAKLANVLFSAELARRYKNDCITSVSLHPGVVRTEIWKGIKENVPLVSPLMILFAPIIYVLTKNCKEGAQTTIHCAIDESVTQSNGEYFADCKVKEMASLGRDLELAKKLWEVSESLVGITHF